MPLCSGMVQIFSGLELEHIYLRRIEFLYARFGTFTIFSRGLEAAHKVRHESYRLGLHRTVERVKKEGTGRRLGPHPSLSQLYKLCRVVSRVLLVRCEYPRFKL